MVGKYQKIVLQENDRDVFCLNDLKLARYLFCSERFKQLCDEKQMKGIQFIELADVPQYFSFYNR
ncbi:Immunity protein 43 domain-containing protein OS=Lysinibacillus sphaericus OX=1421 GN=LS41612_13390 PE=4 SV=1 [Lysinibacillus sphaericus]